MWSFAKWNLHYCRTTHTSSSSGWITVTYDKIRKSPTTGDGSSDGISPSAGIFICGLKGAYHFYFHAEKVNFLRVEIIITQTP